VEIELKLVKDAAITIKNLIETDPDNGVTYWMNILHLQYVVKYADSVELLELIEIITQSYGGYPDDEKGESVWGNYLLYEDFDEDLRSQNVDKFLQCVSEKLSQSKVKELVLHEFHDEDLNSAIGHVASRRMKGLVEVMLSHLNEEDRDEVRRCHVDTAVEITYEEPLTSDITDTEIG
jgi:hypothetical protein